jgi:hypothetical protein
LLEVFDEPLRDGNKPAPTAAKPGLPTSGQRSVPHKANGAGQRPEAKPVAAPAATTGSGALVKGVITALFGVALVPLAIWFVLLWQDMMRPGGDHGMTLEPSSIATRLPDAADSHPKQTASHLEVVLSSPDRIAANSGETVAFPIAIDATEALPVRSIIAVTALPEGASFSAGRPYGEHGWSLRPDEIGDLQLRLAAESATSAMRLDLVAGDGTVLARSETQIGIDALPPVVAMVDDPTLDTLQMTETDAPLPQVAPAEETAAVVDLPPSPRRKPSSSSPVAAAPAMKVNKVKVVTIAPPKPARPHDGAYALGSPADAAPAEWMETKTAVDMHAKAEQSSETVKVAEGGVKMRVMARDKNWVQVNDPKSSTTGWIYNRFLQPTEPPAQ